MGRGGGGGGVGSGKAPWPYCQVVTFGVRPAVTTREAVFSTPVDARWTKGLLLPSGLRLDLLRW